MSAWVLRHHAGPHVFQQPCNGSENNTITRKREMCLAKRLCDVHTCGLTTKCGGAKSDLSRPICIRKDANHTIEAERTEAPEHQSRASNQLQQQHDVDMPSHPIIDRTGTVMSGQLTGLITLRKDKDQI